MKWNPPALRYLAASAALLGVLGSAPVSAQDNQPVTPAPGTDTPATSTPAADTPAAAPSETPAPQAAQGSPFNFGMSASLGTQTIDGTNYESFGFLPDFSWGQLGIGVDLTFHFQFYQEPGGPFGIYPRSQDFWDNSLSTAQNVDKYLSRIVYVRWGHKGDPLYVQAGLLPSTTLGTGFIVGGYDNGILRPDLNYIGLEVDADGSLVGLPYGGVESFVGNISRFDVLGIRGYAKPFGIVTPDNSFLKQIQFGVTVAADTNPYAEALSGVPVPSSASVVVYGLDTMVPLLSGDIFSAEALADADMQGTNPGGDIGIGGKALAIFHWGLENRFLGNNFIPDYFDQGYEINRISKYQIYDGVTPIPGSIGWEASLGTGLLDGQLSMDASLSGPWGTSANIWIQPEFQATAKANIKGFPLGFEAYYIKQGLQSAPDLFSPENAQIGAQIGYNIGAVTLVLVYNLRYLAPGEQGTNGNSWVTTSSIQTTVKMF